MPTTTNAVEVTIRARNEASGELSKLIADLDRLGREGGRAGRGIRELAAPLAFELAPALGTSGAAVARLAGSLATMTTGLGGAITLVTTLAGVVGGILFDSFTKAAKAQEEWKKALSLTDIGAMTTALQKQSDAWRAIATESQKAADLAKQLPATQPGSAALRPGTPYGAGARAGAAAALEEDAEEKRTRTARLLAQKKYFEDTKGIEEANGPGVTAVIAEQEQKKNELLAKIRQKALDDEKKAAEERQQFLFAIARRIGAEALAEEQAILKNSEAFNQAQYDIDERRREAQLQRLGPSGRSEAAEAERILIEGERYNQRQEDSADRRRAAAADLLKMMEQQTGLTHEQADALANIRRDAEALAITESSRLTTDEKRVELMRLQVEAANQARANLERTDPLAGLTKGFEDAARDAGQTMQDFARNTARTMTQTFDDLFFSIFTGRFKDLGKTIANNLLRSISGAAADLITQPAIRALTGGLQGLRGGLVPMAVAGGTALLPAGSVSAYGGTPGIVAPAGGVAGGVPGGGIYDSISQYAGAAGTSLAQYFGFGGAGGAAAFEAATIAGYGGEAAFAGIAGAEGAGVDVFSSGAGLAAGGAGATLGTVGAGIGFLASLYGAYQTRSPGYGAATGAVGGLVAGATLGSIYPVVGTLIGAVVGLIAGAALGAGAGALGGKGGNRSVGAERRSAQAVSEAVTNFSGTLNQAETGEDIINILNRQWAPNGELVIYATASDGSERNALRGMGFSYKDLFDPAIVASITVAAGVTGTARPSLELTQALRGRIQQIAGMEAGLLFATQAKGPGVTRTTYEAFAAALQGSPNVGPRNFFFSTDLATNAGASTAQVGSVIRAFLQTNDALDIAPDLTADRFLSL